MARNQICGIYKITNPKGKIYIGQSYDIETRWRFYKTLFCKKQYKIYRSLIKHGVENHIFEIIEECPKELLNEREIYYGKLFDTLNPKKGLNLSLGRENGEYSEESKKKISLGLAKAWKIKIDDGYVQSDEHKAKNSEGGKRQWARRKAEGFVYKEEWKQKLSETNTGKKHKPESLEKLSESLKAYYKNNNKCGHMTGKTHSDETKAKMSAVSKGIPKGPMSEETKKRQSITKQNIKIEKQRKWGQLDLF